MKQNRNHILIVDDNPNIREALADQLRAAGFVPVTARDGSVALRLLSKYDILIAIVDLMLPGMNGLTVIHAIREHNATIPCIVLTGHVSTETAVQALREHAYDYLIKPVDMDILLRVVHRAAEHAWLMRDKQEADHNLARRSEELAASLAALHDAQERIVRTANAALMGQLAQGLRHELGNALTVIRLNMNLLAYYREDAARFAQHINGLDRGVQSIERIALALRDFPTSDVGEEEQLDLWPVVQQAVRQAQQAHPEFGGALIITRQQIAPVHGVSLQLVQAFFAIIENAIESTQIAQPPVPQITLALRPHNRFWHVVVRDNGGGFSEEALAHAAEPGYTTKVDRGFMRGLGLGLFVASSVIDKHNGRLRLSNRPEGGALVEVWLPQAQADEEATAADG
ncbi:MAG: response regulator [Anaerolineae bacterium]|nr:response regulator [Anaerolineae bacterium]